MTEKHSFRIHKSEDTTIRARRAVSPAKQNAVKSEKNAATDEEQDK
ncbi:hypothetical protein JNUCC74_17590 [Cerasibacillus sp. JNUCC 74]